MRPRSAPSVDLDAGVRPRSAPSVDLDAGVRPRSVPSVDLDAYLDRIGHRGEPLLAAIHRAHVLRIPFENLDPLRGVPVALDLGAIQHKLVTNRRGGYCFEHNLLLRAALEQLGMRAEPMLARVRWGSPAGAVGPLTHLVLRVTDAGTRWLADVGFGSGTLREPIPFGPGGPYEQSGWRFRVIEEGDLHVLQSQAGGEWRDVYAFEPRPVAPVDIDLSNWFTCTHPQSRFTTGLIVVVNREDGGRSALSDWRGELSLVHETPGEKTSTIVPREAIPQLLAEHFGLPQFVLDGAGRVVPA